LADEEADDQNTKDSDGQERSRVLIQLEGQISEMKNGSLQFTLIMDDPTSNSYLEVKLDRFQTRIVPRFA
jgi:C4-type Zn-finger protein